MSGYPMLGAPQFFKEILPSTFDFQLAVILILFPAEGVATLAKTATTATASWLVRITEPDGIPVRSFLPERRSRKTTPEPSSSTLAT
jgi:hypothetical protein